MRNQPQNTRLQGDSTSSLLVGLRAFSEQTSQIAQAREE
jgi:hypothetical protein